MADFPAEDLLTDSFVENLQTDAPSAPIAASILLQRPETVKGGTEFRPFNNGFGVP